MTCVFGWWIWDAEALALVNRVTGERVAYRGNVQDPDLVSYGRCWLRFDYMHSELSFPLLVEKCPAEEKLEKGAPVWRVDYRRSGDLWRRERGGKAIHPAFGTWRRVDDCVTDALACWPESEVVGRDCASYVRFDGGWLNGAWSDTVSRRETRLVFPAKTQPDGDDYNSWLVPLEAPPPSPFQFHDFVPRRNGSEDWSIDNPVLLKGLEFEGPELRYGPRLAANASLMSLEGRTAYLLSEDRRRVLYPYFGETKKRGESGHWKPHFSLIYVDSELIVIGIGRPLHPRRPAADWTLLLRNGGIHVRSSGVDPAFFIKSRPPFPSFPSRPLWLKARWAIVDGWSRWKGSRARNSEWLPELELVGASGVQIALGYRGGQWTATSLTVSY